MSRLKYLSLKNYLKEKIQQEKYIPGDYLPSENELCTQFSVTRTTARKALDELLKEGFIKKHHGKGSQVLERRQSLGLLNVQGFSEAVGENVKTVFLQKPQLSEWDSEIRFPVREKDKQKKCISFERQRCVGDEPVMLEKNWMPDISPLDFPEQEFTDGSFFKTLSKKYLIEIVSSAQELRAEFADKRISGLLGVEKGSPILHISVRFGTSNPDLIIYGELYCNTEKFAIGNYYQH